MQVSDLTEEPRYCSTEELLEIKEAFWKKEFFSGEFARGSLVFWNKPYGYRWIRIDDAVMILYENENKWEFFAPYLGKDVAKTIGHLLEIGARENRKIIIGSFTQDVGLHLMQRYPGQFELSYNRDMSDYIYHVESLAKLSGSRYHKKKNLVNKFKKLYNWTYRSLTKDDKEACLALDKSWMAEHTESVELAEDVESQEAMQFERWAISQAFDYFDELELFGGAILVDDKLVGFSIGERISELMSVTHFEKADLSYTGVFQILNQQFAEHELIPRNITYVNREEDMGLKGLRKSKMSYSPDMILNKYCLIQK
ncbi:MAG: DUF2156 domain-containing protein [Lachnospiraceae bacterium]|nr:DUF2156 domain-containing protein [Candidatus Equihabitans merdae]